MPDRSAPGRHAPIPPLGFMPEWMWLELTNAKRQEQIRAAIHRYESAAEPPKPEWIEELARLQSTIGECATDIDTGGESHAG